MTSTKLKQRCLLITSFAALAVFGTLFGLQPSFYPIKAESVGAKPSEYGLVFGIVNLAAFVSSPFFAHYGDRIGSKLLYNSCSLLQGAAMVAFGFLEYVEDKSTFLGVSYFLRIVEGISVTACMTSLLSILMTKYPAKISIVTGCAEASYGFGLMMGPAIGSGLYMLSGFGLPFFIMGGISIILAFVQMFLIPNVDEEEVQKSQNVESDNSLTLMGVLRHPSILLPFADNFATFFGCGMLEVTLERFMSSTLQSSQWEVGMTFVTYGTFFMVSAPVAGYVCDRLTLPIIAALTGNMFSILAFFLLGPSPLLSITPTLPLLISMVALFGTINATMTVSSTGRASRIVKAKGFEDDMATNFIISGLWEASMQLGAFTGDSAAGFMVESWGFRNSTMFFCGMFLLMSFVDALSLLEQLVRGRGYKQLE